MRALCFKRRKNSDEATMNQFAPEDDLVWGFDSLDFGDWADLEEPEAQLLLQTYIDEAVFFWRFLHPLLVARKPVDVLEVGSGMGLLSLFASTEVREITALEPESAGFGLMSQFRDTALRAWRGDTVPIFREGFLHDLPRDDTFDLIYCINVLEHVPRAGELVEEIYERLRPGGMAWFVLPNYSFPYEQHFEIPIVFNKRITERIFRKRIRNRSVPPDPIGLWAELSWPTQRGLQRFLRSRGWSHEFRKNVFSGYFARLGEPHFMQRKGALYSFFRPLLKSLKPVMMALPLSVTPIIEFAISKPSAPDAKFSAFRR